MQTSCTQCVFNKSTQEFKQFVDCKLGRYNVFNSRRQVSKLDPGLLTTLCTACRDTPTTEEEIVKQLQNAYALVVVDREEGDALQRVKVSLSERQSIAPKEIVVVFKSESSFSAISQYLEEYVKGTKTKFYIKWIPDEEYTDEMIDIAVKELSSISYTLIKGGESLPYDCLELIYKYVDVELKKFAIIFPNYTYSSITGLTILRLFHSYVNGNFAKSVVDKAYEAAENESQDSKDMITCWPIIRSTTNLEV